MKSIKCWKVSLIILLLQTYSQLLFAANWGSGQDNVSRTLENVIDWLTGDVAAAVATLAVVVTGLGCYLGKIQWSRFIQLAVVLGIIYSAAFVTGLAVS